MLRAALILSLCVASALSASPKWRRSVDASNRFMVHGSPRLVGGEPAEPNSFPYQVSFQYAFGGHFCGGIVYDEMHVVTAAHCCTGSAATVKIVAGWCSHILSLTLSPTFQFTMTKEKNRISCEIVFTG